MRTHRTSSAVLVVSAAAFLSAGAAAAPPEKEPGDSRLRDAVARHALATVADRRWFHQNPELGNHEVKTAARIAAALKQLGLQVEHPVGLTGVVGLLDSGRPGATVAVRGEMDALPVTEAENSGNPVRSLNPGVMHACGHDVHMASALGAARVLADIKDSLRGRVLFVFQPAEEGVPPEERRQTGKATGSDKVGADRLVNVDRLFEKYNVQAVFGLHGFPELPAGTIGLAPEYAMAAADSFEIAIRGRSAHAGQSPWTGSDVLHIAAGVVLDLHALPARQTDPRNPKVVSVSMLDCTDGRSNILCRTARLSGTVRAFRAEDRTFLRQGIERTLDAAVKARDPQAGRCRAGDPDDRLCWEIASYEDDGLPVRQNVPLLDWSEGVLQADLGEERVVRGPASLGAEDYAFYCEKAPCVFLGLGTAPPGGTGGLHTPRYAPSEESIPIGMRVLATLAARWLAQR
jgi:amidohydrolase